VNASPSDSTAIRWLDRLLIVELVALTPSRLLVVLILSTGRVEQRLVELGSGLTDDELADLRLLVNRAAK